MNKRVFVIVATALLAVSACSKPESPPPTAQLATEQAPTTAKPSFINQVWAVAESEQAEVGSLRVFLSEGTLVLASPNAEPSFGTWMQEDGRLKITEEGLNYDADILELSESAFRIRIHSPGEPVEMLFTPAKHVPAVVARAVERTVDDSKPVATQAVTLWGTAWRLESLAGASVLDRAQATLEFPEEGRASGSGSCNRFNGVLTVDGSAIKFGGIAATRMACAEAVMKQEDTYFSALRDAERFESDGQTLHIYAAGRSDPLRFVATQAAAAPPVNRIARAPAAATPALTGIWTVVAHHMPGTGALTDSEARARHGETLRLTERSAISPGGRCGDPSYAASRVAAEAYLASEFKLPRGSLKPLAAKDLISVMKVLCGGAPWTAFGGLLLQIDGDRALAPWDGVFFELKRDRDFRAMGQEPGWQLEIKKGAEIRFTYDYGKGTAVTPAPAAQMDPASGTRNYHAVTEANDLRVVIVPVACADSMSGRPFKATVSVTLNGRTFRGCGEELTTPYQG